MLVLRLVLGVVGAVLAAWMLLIAMVFFYGQRDNSAPADAIVVLGAAQYDGRPSPVLRARVDHAVGLYEADVAPRLIMTGGVGVGDTVSEARVGQRYATRAGVPAEHILVEEVGIRSLESLQAVAHLMEEEGIETVVMVSDPFHMLRLRILARRLGIRMRSSPTRTSPISADREEEWRFILRESLIIPTLLLPF